MNLEMMSFYTLTIFIPAATTAARLSITLGNNGEEVKPVRQLWTSTGFCPPSPHQDFKDFVKQSSVIQNLAMIGALPYAPQQFQVRIHWLLDLITVNNNKTFNYAVLDNFVQSIHSSGLALGFELMGNPNGIFTNFEEKRQVLLWYELVKGIAMRYNKIHRNWNYESWNEPDHSDFDGLNFTVHGYLNYVDASEKGVHDADMDARFGGPGGSCRLTGFSKLCWALMDHVTKGKNCISGKMDTRLDFISIHAKGGKGSDGNSTLLYETELATLKYLQANYPKLKHVPIYNDESDPITGWSKPHEFRADNRYPAMVVKLIAKHLHSKDSEFTNLVMSSNDNAFLNYAPHYFTQRTLFATFLVNNTARPYAVLVKKPIFDVMALLAQVKGVTNVPSGKLTDEYKGIIRTSVNNQHMLTFWSSNDTAPLSTSESSYSVSPCAALIGGYYIIRRLSHTASVYNTWKNLGSPGNLTDKDTETLWNTTGIVSTKPTLITTKPITVVIPGTAGVTQLLMCNGAENLTQPYNLTFLQIKKCMVIIFWSDAAISDCFLTYELQIRRPGEHDFVTINKNILLTRFYQFTSEYGISGDYRIRSTNILGQVSNFSVTMSLNG